MRQVFYTMRQVFQCIINNYLTFKAMKFNSSKVNWKQLLEILLVASIIGLLIFVVIFIL